MVAAVAAVAAPAVVAAPVAGVGADVVGEQIVVVPAAS